MLAIGRDSVFEYATLGNKDFHFMLKSGAVSSGQ